jgi:hypothetical protein
MSVTCLWSLQTYVMDVESGDSSSCFCSSMQISRLESWFCWRRCKIKVFVETWLNDQDASSVHVPWIPLLDLEIGREIQKAILVRDIFTWMSLALPVSVKKFWSVEEVNWLWLQSRSKTDAARGVSRPAGCLTATICKGIVCSMAVFIWGITRMFEAFRSPCINHKWRSKGL